MLASHWSFEFFSFGVRGDRQEARDDQMIMMKRILFGSNSLSAWWARRTGSRGPRASSKKSGPNPMGSLDFKFEILQRRAGCSAVRSLNYEDWTLPSYCTTGEEDITKKILISRTTESTKRQNYKHLKK